MRGSILKLAVLIACFVTVLESVSFAQSNPKFGAGFKVSTLGIGVEAATSVTDNSNVRAGFNWYGYDRNFNRDGINYAARLQLRSVEAHYDWFGLGHGFRVSPGLLVYNGNRVKGTGTVGAGQQFTLGGTTYYSSPSDPVNGPFTVDLGKYRVAPMITAGFGNLLKRSGGPVSITAEAGVVFEGEPRAHLTLGGSAGGSPLGPFASVSSNPQIQASLREEENKINTGAPPYDTSMRNVLKFYPVISVGIGFRIK